MYFYSKKSRSKIIHTDECHHVLGTGIDDIGSFESLHEAYDGGYRFCKHCNPMHKRYKRECEDILRMSAAHGLSVYSGNRYVSIASVISKWKITLDNDKNMILYHKNEFKKPGDEFSEVLGYHLQGDVCKNSILSYLEYVIEHDYFRMMHPIRIPKVKKVSSPARKGTKRYKSEQRRNEKKQRKQAIRNVLELIDSLKAPSALSRAAAAY